LSRCRSFSPSGWKAVPKCPVTSSGKPSGWSGSSGSKTASAAGRASEKTIKIPNPNGPRPTPGCLIFGFRYSDFGIWNSPVSSFNHFFEFNFRPDYGYSDQNRRHQFVAQPVIFGPWGIEVSSAIRFLTGTPFSPGAGSDFNEDKANNDRPYYAFGVPFTRNNYTNKSLTFVDLRVQKSIKITESKQFKLSAELFNLFNLMNLTYASTQTNFCTQTVKTCGVPQFQGAAGSLGWTPNVLFQQLRNPTTGAILTSNNAGVPFESQFTFKFIF